MLTTARLISNGQEALPDGTFVNIRQDENGKYTWGTINAAQNTPANPNDVCQLILASGEVCNVVIKSFFPPEFSASGWLIVFEVP